MSRKTLLMLLACLIGLVAAPTGADDEPAAEPSDEAADYGRPGNYAGGGLALGFDAFKGGGASEEDFSTGVGVDAWVGYRLLSNVAIEAQFEYLGRFDEGSTSTSILTFMGNIKGFFFTGRIQPYGVVGIGGAYVRPDKTRFGNGNCSLPGSKSTDCKDSGMGFAARIGAGIDYWLTPQVSLGASYSYVLTTGGAKGRDYQNLVMAAQYRF